MASPTNYVSVNTIVPKVYKTSQYKSTGAEKAAELTTLLQALLAWGVFETLEDAFLAGVPVGTFVVIDDPATPEEVFVVDVVRDFGNP